MSLSIPTPPSSNDSLEPRTSAEVTPKSTVEEKSVNALEMTKPKESSKSIGTVKIEDASIALKILPKGVREFFYSKPVAEFSGRKVLSEELLIKLPAINYKSIHPESFECLKSPGLICELDLRQLAEIPPEGYKHISNEAMMNMSKDQSSFILKHKLYCIDSPLKIDILYANCLNKRGLPTIPDTLVAAMDITKSLLLGEKIERISQTEIQAVPPSVIENCGSKIALFKDSISLFTKDQFKAVGPQHIPHMTQTQAVIYAQHHMDQIPPECIPVLLLKIPDSGENHSLRERLSKLSPFDKDTNAKESRKLDLKYLKPDGIETLPRSFLQDSIKNGELKHMSSSLLQQITSVRPDLLVDIDGSIEEFNHLRMVIKKMPLEVLSNLPNGLVLRAQSYLPIELQGMPSYMLKDLVMTGVFKELDKEQVALVWAALLSTFDKDNWEKIPKHQMAWLDIRQVGGIKPSVLSELSSAKIIEVYDTLFSKLNITQIESLEKGIVDAQDIPESQKALMLAEISLKKNRAKP